MIHLVVASTMTDDDIAELFLYRIVSRLFSQLFICVPVHSSPPPPPYHLAYRSGQHYTIFTIGTFDSNGAGGDGGRGGGTVVSTNKLIKLNNSAWPV